eukprot:355993-Chlamydomonas_euryale.AAC.2
MGMFLAFCCCRTAVGAARICSRPAAAAAAAHAPATSQPSHRRSLSPHLESSIKRQRAAVLCDTRTRACVHQRVCRHGAARELRKEARTQPGLWHQQRLACLEHRMTHQLLRRVGVDLHVGERQQSRRQRPHGKCQWRHVRSQLGRAAAKAARPLQTQKEGMTDGALLTIGRRSGRKG